ncbi:hypothetical protein ONZ43_g7034 [Nemania bipapillata]|uniref:Uncharacterized protein n=1 Tax=Nemania bipapillata TaxID=110536 RepID=A0ACC2HUU1_9PEZI|nr:hypothetical protein ONZ43_g7034 [Nemania bipapillata]
MHFSTFIASAAALVAGASAQINPSANATIGQVQLYGDSGCTNETNKITQTALFGGIGLCYFLHFYPAPLDTVAIKIDYTDVGTQNNCASTQAFAKVSRTYRTTLLRFGSRALSSALRSDKWEPIETSYQVC